jgi:hypothetical protein
MVTDSAKYFYGKHLTSSESIEHIYLFVGKISGKSMYAIKIKVSKSNVSTGLKISSFPIEFKIMVTSQLGSNEVRFYFYKEYTDSQAEDPLGINSCSK